MKLYGTPPSHFSRKVRVLLQELDLSFEFVGIENLMAVGAQHFANNPLHQFPVLEDGGRSLIESDLICRYLIEQYGQGKAISSFMPSPEQEVADLQRLAIMNGGMSAGVTLIRTKRSGVADYMKFPYFQQEEASLHSALTWLDRDLGDRIEYYPGRFTMLDITLMCFAEWAVFREFAPNLPKNIERFVSAHRARPSLASTHPARGMQ